MQYGYRNGQFSMAVGLRSGVMDQLTFLGIPTVSIGLRNMVAENRHVYLARDFWKTVNVQYSQPRHVVTAWMSEEDLDLLVSPYWLAKAPARVAARVPRLEAGSMTDRGLVEIESDADRGIHGVRQGDTQDGSYARGAMASEVGFCRNIRFT